MTKSTKTKSNFETSTSERAKKFGVELDTLIKEGKQLQKAIFFEAFPIENRDQLKSLGYDKDEQDEFINNLPDFKKNYQRWYSKAQAVVKQVLPDRYSDFNSHYEYPRARKEILFENYMVRDYLQGLVRKRNGIIIVDVFAAIPEFDQQLNMIEAARDSLESKLMDLAAILQADLFDTEIESAGALAKAGHLRAAGVICGVVIEKHLQYICSIHNVIVTKKKPVISDLSLLLRNANVITLPQERFLQHLADIRNICGHAKEREPNKEEVRDLVSGTEKVIKTIY